MFEMIILTSIKNINQAERIIVFISALFVNTSIKRINKITRKDKFTSVNSS